MPVFELEKDGKIFEVDAPSAEKAISTFKAHVGGGQESGSYDQGGFRAATDGAFSGMMLGADDEIAAGMLAPIEATKNWFQGKGFDLGDAYTGLQKHFDTEKTARREAHPVASTVGEVAGGLGTAAGLGKAGVTLAGRNIPGMSNAMKAGIEGAGYGAAIGAGEAAPGERTRGAMIGGAVGFGTGALASKIGDKIVNRRAASQLDTSDVLKQQANDLYDASEKAGALVKGKSLKRTVGNLKMKLAPQIKNERLYGETIGMVEYLDDQAKAGTLRLRDIDELRQVVGDSIADASKREKRTLMMVKDAIDDYVDNLKPGDIAGGNIKAATDFLKQGREMFARHSKQEVIEEIFHKARNQATGFENGLRVHFRALANNKKKFSRFSKDEQAAILKIVRGGPIENTLRAFAWFSPQKTLGAFGTGMMAVEGGMGPASAMAAGGLAATKAAEKATAGNVRALEQLLQGVQRRDLPKAIQSAIPGLSTITSGAVARR